MLACKGLKLQSHDSDPYPTLLRSLLTYLVWNVQVLLFPRLSITTTNVYSPYIQPYGLLAKFKFSHIITKNLSMRALLANDVYIVCLHFCFFIHLRMKYCKYSCLVQNTRMNSPSKTSRFADNVMRENSITVSLCFFQRQSKGLVKCTFVAQCTLAICTAERGSDTTAVPASSALHAPPRRGKELERSIQISPVCSHPSSPASASQSRSYFVFVFCAASPGTQMQFADSKTVEAHGLIFEIESYSLAHRASI